ncbi:hypothetical protein TSUD_279670 [Trifolium subterraneum]|uniref:Uncharacterized protein n=1 Tax=Trifolium subterraneum TaxID=3900 RepID=A0A2Z6MU30_TRISU|nr:hypothetical protein TSUD_279670 [Trifolium subterraneum]
MKIGGSRDFGLFTGDKCDCALFGDYVDELNKKMGKSYVDKPSLQNVMNTTRILINSDIHEVEEFQNSIVVHGIEIDGAVPMIGECVRSSLEEEFLRMHLKKSLAKLNNLCEDGVFRQTMMVLCSRSIFTPTQVAHSAIDLDSNGLSDEPNDDGDLEPLEFLKDLIVTRTSL